MLANTFNDISILWNRNDELLVIKNLYNVFLAITGHMKSCYLYIHVLPKTRTYNHVSMLLGKSK